MSTPSKYTPPPASIQTRHLRQRYGLSESRARLVAQLFYEHGKTYG